MSNINIVSVERALNKLIAGKIGLIVDREIFRGSLPAGADGFAVAIINEELRNEPGERIFTATIYGKSPDRDFVMQKFIECAEIFPMYGGPGKLVDETAISFYAIFKVSMDFAAIPDNGRIKTEGLLKLKIRF